VFETRYTFGTVTSRSFDDARDQVIAGLRAEGFGVLTEIDVAVTLRTKLGVDRPPYTILGACNPPLAHRALEADPSVGALLPCNVVIRRDADDTVVEVMDPAAALGLVDEPAIAEVAAEARARLLRMVRELEASLPATPVAAAVGAVR
jgi:uncharacterized protein (DUF302 family)